jgi:1-acyl-sn-glycerol-3-phosphate acyltransferase
MDVSVRGLDNVPEKGPAIIVANHPSILDGLLMVAFIKRRIHTFAKAKVFNSKFKMLFLRSVGGIPVASEATNKNALLEAEKLLKNNKLLFIFPEGKINAEPDMLPFNRSFLRLAVKFNAPVTPVAILGSDKALSIGQYFPRPFEIYVSFLKPLRFNISDESPDKLLNKKELQYYVEKVRNIIQNKFNILREIYEYNLKC